MKILIVDDSKLDRKMLRDMIKMDFPEYEIHEAANIKEMYSKLLLPYDLLFQDISLLNLETPDSEGLKALNNLIETYPELPIAIITGYARENISEFHRDFLGRSQIIHFLEKDSYDIEKLLEVFEKAIGFKAEVDKIKKEKSEIEELLKELIENEEKRIQEKVNENISDFLRDEDERVRERTEELINTQHSAIFGNNWEIRIINEYKITGKCNLNSLSIISKIEALVNKILKGSDKKYPTFYKGLQYVRNETGMSEESFGIIIKAWSKIRNPVIHEAKDATKNDALQLMKCLRILEKTKK